MNRQTKLAKSRVLALVVTLLLLVIAGTTVFAKDHPARLSGETAHVIAHIPITGGPATQMFLRSLGGKHYLYLDQAYRGSETVIDVTKPSRAFVVRRVVWPAEAEGHLTVLSRGLAFTETPDTDWGAEGSSQPIHKSVSIMDLTDPIRPRVLQGFSSATSVLPDAERNLIFVADDEGLWIVRHHVSQSTAAERNLCTSEAAISPLPDCY